MFAVNEKAKYALHCACISYVPYDSYDSCVACVSYDSCVPYGSGVS